MAEALIRDMEALADADRLADRDCDEDLELDLVCEGDRVAEGVTDGECVGVWDDIALSSGVTSSSERGRVLAKTWAMSGKRASKMKNLIG